MGFGINTVVMDGNLTKDPELRSTRTGIAVVSLRIAHNDRYKPQDGDWQDRPGFYDWSVWKGQGEWIAANLHKGDRVVLKGRVQWREWETDDGAKRQVVDFVADDVIPVPRREGAGGGASYQSDVPPPDDYAPVPASASKASDDDIPF